MGWLTYETERGLLRFPGRAESGSSWSWSCSSPLCRVWPPSSDSWWSERKTGAGAGAVPFWPFCILGRKEPGDQLRELAICGLGPMLNRRRE